MSIFRLMYKTHSSTYWRCAAGMGDLDRRLAGGAFATSGSNLHRGGIGGDFGLWLPMLLLPPVPLVLVLLLLPLVLLRLLLPVPLMSLSSSSMPLYFFHWLRTASSSTCRPNCKARRRALRSMHSSPVDPGMRAWGLGCRVWAGLGFRVATWVLHGCYMGATWVLHGCYMGATWVLVWNISVEHLV